MDAVHEKRLSEETRLKLVREIISMFRKQDISFGQSIRVLDDAKKGLYQLPLNNPSDHNLISKEKNMQKMISEVLDSNK